MDNMNMVENYDNNKIFAKIFLWMFIGLLVTFGVGYYVSSNEIMVENIHKNSTFLIIAIVEIVLCIVLSARIRKMNPLVAKTLYLLYAGLTGLTFSVIFIIYELESIMFVFGITSIVCLIFGLIGYYTKIDLTKLGTFLFMALIAVIIASIINIFIGSDAFNLGICILSLVIFIGYMAYDIQVIKRGMYGNINEENLAIYGAFQIYLDFINIFIRLLELFGKRRD
ncbi:MAG: Bax inhibitor-1/YccA family protein [Bacilli bacterium]|nr:Bax inhibitor-1/YccA family protein [Bacilli bacterium]